MKYKIILLMLLLIPVSISINFSAASALTGDEALAKLSEKLANAGTMKGKINISYQSGEIYSGIFMYMQPGKLYVKFTDPPGKLIVTNGKKLWIYDSTTDVCGVQELETYGEVSEDNEKQIRPRLRGGIQQFLQGYESTYTSGSSSQNIIELVNPNKIYSDIKFILNSDFMIISAVFKNADGNGFSIKLSDVKTGDKITPGIFNFKAPANAQVIKNPLDVR